jgi:hypothetical protein
LNCHGWQWQLWLYFCAFEGSSIAGFWWARGYLQKRSSHTGCVWWHVESPVLGGNPLYRVSKWRTFVGKMPLQTLSFRVKLRCVPRKILFAQVAACLEGKGFAGFRFFSRPPWIFFFFFLRF